MKIIAFSDSHGEHRQLEYPKGDVLVFAGDWSPGYWGNNIEKHKEIAIDFFDCLYEQEYENIIVIAGNHDFWPFLDPIGFREKVLKRYPDKITYLQNDSLFFKSVVNIEGKKFFGSPWTPWFHNWAFNFPKFDYSLEVADKHWNNIPAKCDVLITHGPPNGILDFVKRGENVGCQSLLKQIKKKKPKYHVFGHIHESYGRKEEYETVFLNSSIVRWPSFQKVTGPVYNNFHEFEL